MVDEVHNLVSVVLWSESLSNHRVGLKISIIFSFRVLVVRDERSGAFSNGRSECEYPWDRAVCVFVSVCVRA